MNQIKPGVLGLLLILCTCFSVSAQPIREPDYNKPKLFADLPKRVAIPRNSLLTLLELQPGQETQFLLAPGTPFRGTVVSSSDGSDPKVQSVVIRSSSRNGATFTFTRTEEEEGVYAYIGRMISFNHSDAFELEEEKGDFILVKKDLYDLFSE